jgi:dolichyl-diphosphooligosaccharide--protein glycosyltransferase
MNKLQKFLPNHRTFLLLFVSVLLVYGVSFYQRKADYNYWMEHPQDYVVEDVTAMSGMDSYYWLRMARELDAGHIGKNLPDPTKGYPDLQKLAIKDTPSLLAELISIGKNFTGGDYYRSGLLLIPILAGLFVFPLFFYFYELGFGASAILGGLVGTFGHAYYDRTMMGRVDTDLLNTFFPFAVACFILQMRKEKSWRVNIGLSIGAGLTMCLYTRWYQQPSFILVYLFVMALYLLFCRVSWKQILPMLLVFLLASGPEYVLQIASSARTFLWAYVSPPPTGGLAWPNILKTVAEAQNRSLAMKFDMLYGFWPVVFAGFVGLAYLYVRRFRQMIPVTPLIMLGAWSLVGPGRFVMYLAPLIGIGAGVLIELLVRYAMGKFRLQPLLPTAASLALMFTLFFSTSAYTGFSSHTAPIMSGSLVRAMVDIRKLVPQHSAMFTPFWEYSYALMDIGGFATYHDGGLQGGMRSTLTAQAMLATRQEEMVSLISYLEDFGFNPLAARIRKEKMTAAQMKELVFNYPKGFSGENVYVLYFGDMIWKFASMSYFGTWDFAQRKSETTDYVELKCFSQVNDIMTCSDGTVDMNRGVMNDGSVDIPLRAVLLVNDGYVVNQKNYPTNEGYYLQILMKNNKINMILVADERLYQSNFNQQYLLGNYDRRYFEEVYNDFPSARLLKVKKAEAIDSAQ